MPTLKLSPAAVRRLTAPHHDGKQAVYATDQRGLQIVVSGSSSSRSWAVQGNLLGKTTRITIAPLSAQVGAEEIARMARKAQDYRELMRLGIDPRKEVERRAQQVAAEEITLAALFDAYRETPKWAKLRAGTRKVYGLAWRTMLEPSFAKKPARHLTLADLVGAHGRWTARQTKSMGLARLAVILLSGIWKNARLMGLLERSLMCPSEDLGSVIPGWEKVAVRKSDVPDELLGAFWNAIGEVVELAVTRKLIKVILLTGMRSLEARGLRWKEVNLEQRVAVLPADRIKTGKEFQCPLSAEVVGMLRQLWLVREGEQERGCYRQKEFVFALGGDHLDRPHPAINRDLKMVAKAAGVSGSISTHTLRKVFGRIAEESISLGSAKKLLNHSVGRDVTLAHYGHRSFAQLLRDTDRVTAEIMGRIAEGPVASNVVELSA